MEVVTQKIGVTPNQNPDVRAFGSRGKFEKSNDDYVYEEIRYLRLHNDLIVEYSKSLLADRNARENYGYAIFWWVFGYMAVVLGILCLNDFMHIKDNVLIALIGSTSINVIGLLAIVLRSTFSNHHHKILDGNSRKD